MKKRKCFYQIEVPLRDVRVQGEEKHMDKTWAFPRIGVPQNGWFIMENPIKTDDLGYHYFLETPTSQDRVT